MEKTHKKDLLSLWIFWQFFEMPKFLFEVWNNYFIFVYNVFSIPLLVKNFFSPWRKYRWAYPRGLDIGAILETFASNMISRILGAIMRIFLILIGILCQILVAIIGILLILGWILVPFIIVFISLFILFY